MPVRLLTAVGWWLAAAALLFLVMWPLGLLAGWLEGSVDWPAFRWAQSIGAEPWLGMHDVVTRMGNTPATRLVTVVGAVGFTVARLLLRRPHVWLPLVALPAAYVTEHYIQLWSAGLVDRGHPPTTLGTWPSGGVARTILIYGLVCYFALLLVGVERVLRWTWVVAMTLGAVEAWTRIYTLRHWITDAIGGLFFGAALLVLVLVAVRIVEQTATRRGGPRSPTP